MKALTGAYLIAAVGLTAACTPSTFVVGTPATPVNVREEPMTAPQHLLRVRSHPEEDLSTRNMLLVRLAFENDSPEWHHVEELSLRVARSRSEVVVQTPMGEELRSWHRAATRRRELTVAHRRALLGLFSVAGTAMTVGGIVKSDRELVAAGLTATAAADATQQAREERDQAEAQRTAQLVPDTHLLNVPFSVPPGLFAEKWVLLYTPTLEEAHELPLVLEYRLRQGATERVLIAHPKSPKRQWQEEADARRARRRGRIKPKDVELIK